MSEEVEFAAKDGVRLGGTVFHPEESNGRAVVINPATGAPQTYYARFAEYLATRGFTVLVYDYRGIGRSRRRGPPPGGRHLPLRHERATMRDWALLDASAALGFLGDAAAGARLQAVGHSFGGQAIALVPGSERLAAVLWVASQSGYWKNWPAGVPRAGMWLLTHAILPSVSRAFGRFPMAAFGQGEDLPAGVAIEWARWCRHPGYLVGVLDAHDRYASFSAPIRAYWISDDRYAPRRAVEAMLELHPAAHGELRAVRRSEHGGRPIGHFGFFRDRFRDTLWKDAADWLAAH